MRRSWLLAFFALSLSVHAKTFQNSYVSFQVPDDWTCTQEGVAWTCTPQNPVSAKEAVIVLAAKVAGPEDNLTSFLNFLKQPKKIATKVGTPMPSLVMYAQQRTLGDTRWVQAQHLGSEIQDFYTLYLATVKDQLSILISFSAEKNHYKAYNPIFDQAIKTLKIVANQKLLFAKSNPESAGDTIGIRESGSVNPTDLAPPPVKRQRIPPLFWIFILVIVVGGFLSYYWLSGPKPKSKTKSRR